jgi:hypothetical protein
VRHSWLEAEDALWPPHSWTFGGWWSWDYMLLITSKSKAHGRLLSEIWSEEMILMLAETAENRSQVLLEEKIPEWS